MLNLSPSPVQEFCRIYAQFFPFGDPEPLASLVFRGFGVRGGGEGGAGGGGVVGFHQFITALSAATKGSTEERLARELFTIIMFLKWWSKMMSERAKIIIY